MKKMSLLLLVLCLAFTQGMAQSTKKKSSSKKKKKEEYSLKQHLWYGGSFVLGFSGQNGYNAFQFGVAPMVGYKFTNWLSAGPRIAPTYLSVKGPSNVGVSRANLLDFEYGLFTRAKIYNGIYIQGEYGGRSLASPLFGNVGSDGKVPIIRERRTDYLVGGGFSQSDGGWGTDISILYNIAVAQDLTNLYESPLVFRFGLSYNF
jgi:hypothetical protein